MAGRWGREDWSGMPHISTAVPAQALTWWVNLHWSLLPPHLCLLFHPFLTLREKDFEVWSVSFKGNLQYSRNLKQKGFFTSKVQSYGFLCWLTPRMPPVPNKQPKTLQGKMQAKCPCGLSGWARLWSSLTRLHSDTYQLWSAMGSLRLKMKWKKTVTV